MNTVKSGIPHSSTCLTACSFFSLLFSGHVLILLSLNIPTKGLQAPDPGSVDDRWAPRQLGAAQDHLE